MMLCCPRANAWGDEGHEVIGAIADHFLSPPVRVRVQSLLAGDATQLTARDIAHESTWADRYRDSDRNGSKVRYNQTRKWHYIDLELDGADLTAACFGRRETGPGMSAALGAADDCVVDKLEQFSGELRNPSTDAGELVLALQFVLHLVGDLHQPLHAGDDRDQGGNGKFVTAPGMRSGNLHHYWDTEFVALLGPNAADIAQRLIAQITPAERARWSAGTPDDWAMESYAIAKAQVYGPLPVSSGTSYALTPGYVADATRVTAEQLSKAGVRLAWVLNRALQ